MRKKIDYLPRSNDAGYRVYKNVEFVRSLCHIYDVVAGYEELTEKIYEYDNRKDFSESWLCSWIKLAKRALCDYAIIVLPRISSDLKNVRFVRGDIVREMAIYSNIKRLVKLI